MAPVRPVHDLETLADALGCAGFVAARDEALELLSSANGDEALLERLVRRRLGGEPLAWITGSVSFCGITVHVDPGVYVPRWQSEPLACRAVERLPPRGTALDVCAGAGAIAALLRARRPAARVAATELDVRAAACATDNGVEVHVGDLYEPLPRELVGRVDVVVGVVPYVPTAALALLPHGTLDWEAPLAYDGGPDGTAVLRKVAAGAPAVLGRPGALLLELGAGQADLIAEDLLGLGFAEPVVLVDDDGDVRGIEATLPAH